MGLEQMSKTWEHSVNGVCIDIYPFKLQTIDLVFWAYMDKKNLVPVREKELFIFLRMFLEVYTQWTFQMITPQKTVGKNVLPSLLPFIPTMSTSQAGHGWKGTEGVLEKNSIWKLILDKRGGGSEHLIDKISDLMAGYSWKLEKVIKDVKSGVFDKVLSQKQ